MTLSMKVFRWVLSHLTLIIVLSLILYVYWNRNELFSDNASESPLVADSESDSPNQAVDFASVKLNPKLKGNDKNPDIIKKSIEKHAIIDKVQQEPAVYPSDMGIEATVSEPVNTEPVYSDPLYSEKVESDTTLLPEGFSERKRKYEQKLALQTGDTEQYSGDSVPQPQVANQTSEFSDSPEREVSSESASTNPVSFQDEELQQQIRDRQKKLSHQMVSLINLTMERSEAAVEAPEIDIEPVKPVIETPEQKNMVLQARQAFEQRDFELAEEKYLQLMNQLPELPDVVGELANVYKTQNRQSDYIAMNTKFVKRLVAHYRFKEAWRVMTETAKFDKESANKQRRIINKKQQELKL